MKFERLNSSVALNAREKPSIYMAMCMVESLFRDVEDASGNELSHTELGDEQLPTKLIWLGRQLLKIYSENSESMLRNRERLDKMMEKVREQEKALAEAARFSDELSAVKERHADLSRKLEEAEAERQETEHLTEACKEVQDRLKLLEGINPTKARAELERLTAMERQMSAESSNLARGLEQRQSRVRELEALCDGLKRDTALCQSRLEELTTEWQGASAALEELKTGIAARGKGIACLTRDKDKLINEQVYLEQQIRQQRKELEDYEQVHIAPLRTEQEDCVQKRTQLDDELRKLKQERDEAVLQVGRLNASLAEIRKAQNEKTQELQQKLQAADLASEQLTKLQKQTDGETERLAALQREAAELEQTRLPKLQSFLAEQMQQKKQLEDSIAGMEQRKEKLLLEVNRLKQDEASLNAEVAELQQTHDTLTQSSEANSEAIKTLRKNVEELRGKNDREKERQYLQQLKEEQERLTELNRSCEDLERQVAVAQINLERKQNQVDELQKKKEDAEQALQKISVLSQNLAPYGDLVLQRRVTALQNRQRLLENTHENLEEAVAMMQSMLGTPPESLTTNPDGLSESLQLCGRSLDRLQKALVKCANNVTKDIKMDTIMEDL